MRADIHYLPSSHAGPQRTAEVALPVEAILFLFENKSKQFDQ